MFNRVKGFFSSAKKLDRAASAAESVVSVASDAVDHQPAASDVEDKERGDALMRSGELQQAAQCYRDAVVKNPNYFAAHINLGFVLTQQGFYQEALPHLTRALELDSTSVDAHYLSGKLYAAQGQSSLADGHFRAALRIAPEFLPAYGDLCALLVQSRQLDSAVQLIHDGLKHHPDCAELHYYLGNLYFEQRQLDLAAQSLQAAIRIEPEHKEAIANLGLTLLQKGDLDQAVPVLQKALNLHPNSADICNNLGSALHGQRQFEQAVAVFNKGLASDPYSVRLHSNLGLSLHGCERFDEAIAQFREALVLNPDHTEAYFGLGNSFFAQKQTTEAIAAFQTFLSRDMRHLDAHNNLGNAYLQIGDLTQALACFEQALVIDSNYSAAYYGKATVLRRLKQFEAAETSFRQAIRTDPDFLDAHVGLADVMGDQGKLAEAIDGYKRVLEIDPDRHGVRWTLAMLNLPAIADTDEEVVASRIKFAHALAELSEQFDPDRMETGDLSAANMLPFYLAYQEENNCDLVSAYGALYARLSKAWADRCLPPVTPIPAGGKPRIGIVSAHIFKSHSVWSAIVKGWFEHLDLDRIDLHVFYLGTTQDEDTEWAKSRSTSFEQGEKEFSQWADIIRQQQVDVLIYPEIGMDRLTAKLSSIRLAPVQVTTWGHPETSGLPTIDYYLSAEDLEPANAQHNYTEKLILLPRLGCHYYRAEVESVDPDLRALGLNPDVPLLLCPGSPFKYAPKHDHVFTDIAARLGKCQFIFFSYHPLQVLNDKFLKRLQSAFAKANMNFEDFCVFIPWQDKPTFYGLMRRVHVFLDTIGFSGFNTAIQAMECALPVVTREGRFLRGRLASGILRRMGLPELVVDTEAAYVDLAVKLVRDTAYRDQIRQRIPLTTSILFNDVSSVRALEEFLISTTKALRAGSALNE